MAKFIFNFGLTLWFSQVKQIIYFIPIKIRAPLIFVRKLKGVSSRCTNARKLKGDEKMPQMNKIYSKMRGLEN